MKTEAYKLGIWNISAKCHYCHQNRFL